MKAQQIHRNLRILRAVLAIVGGAIACSSATFALSAEISACLITKSEGNPLSAAVQKAAAAEAKGLGMILKSFSGRIDGDTESQIAAIENCIADGAKGIMINASDARAIVPAVKKARDAGLLVIALETPLEPAAAADMTFGADNLRAGKALGEWARDVLGQEARTAKVGFLDQMSGKPTVEALRDQGFLMGFGIDPKDVNKLRDENDARIVSHGDAKSGEEEGRRAMENLLRKDPIIDVVRTDDGPVALGANRALEASGKRDKTLIVSADGCAGVNAAAAGVVDGTFMTNTKALGSLGVRAIERFATSGQRPSAGKNFQDTGGVLVAGSRVRGQEKVDPTCDRDPFACAYKSIRLEQAQAMCKE